MSATGGTGRSPAGSQAMLARSRDVFAGLSAAIVSVAYGLSFATLIFAPPLNLWLAYGIAATFITSAISALFVAARSSMPFAIAAPDGATAAVTATLAATVAERLIENGPPDDLLAPVMIVVALATALTGVLLFCLGLARAGGAIRFIPYPVIGGFLSATGWLMVSGAVHVITDQKLTRASLAALTGPTILAQLAAAAGVAIALYFALRRVRSPLLLPGVLLAAAILAHAVFALSGLSLADARILGWTFEAPHAVGLAPTWDLTDLRNFPWHLIPSLSADIFAVMFVTAVTMLLNTTGIELLTRREANLQRELTTLGAANLVAAGLGGYVSCISLSRTTMTYTAGGRSRLCGLAVAAVSALMLAIDPSFLAYIPKFVLGGLLLYLGASLMYEWLVDAARRISLLE
jgi:SulP family sulfate permease